MQTDGIYRVVIPDYLAGGRKSYKKNIFKIPAIAVYAADVTDAMRRRMRGK